MNRLLPPPLRYSPDFESIAKPDPSVKGSPLSLLKSFVWLVLAICLLGRFALAQPVIPDRPRSGYVLDRAGLLDITVISQINSISSGSLREAQAPIVVVTIPALSHYGGHSVESYAATLFNAWRIGDPRVNRGVLLLVAKDDRRARIEMGAGWSHSKDSECEQIMEGWIIPSFKRGDYAKGILDGVTALDSLVRTDKVPRPPLPPWVWPVGIGGGVFLVLMIIDLIQNRMKGWVGTFLRWMTDTGPYRGRGFWSSGSSGWSSGGGGGFSGGSSGGGGSSGSW